MTIFGREPAAWIGLIEAGLALAVASFLTVTDTQVGLIMAAITTAFGLYTAWVTNETLLGVVVGLTKAVLALAIGFGLTLTPELTASLIAFVTVFMGLFNRTQASPVAAPPARPVTA